MYMQFKEISYRLNVNESDISIMKLTIGIW